MELTSVQPASGRSAGSSSAAPLGTRKESHTMRTVTDNLQEVAKGIQELLENLLLNHSSIYEWNRPGGPIVVISAHGNYAYRELDEAGRRIQSKALEEYRRFSALLNVLLRGQPKDSLRFLSKSDTVLTRTIEQQHTPCKNTQEALDRAVEALQAQLDLVKHLYDSSSGEAAYVPDTNALLYNPGLETWAFDKTPKFTLILVPAILSELDALKINHRNETVRQKAETMIRQIKEYRRRGNLTEGVPIVKDKIDIVAIATEPSVETSLPWLDPENKDDRFLAAVIEVMRNRPRSPIVIVSRDINLQNKAEFARIPFVEPPEPACA